jgi:peptidoglycan L-alanyl-D-glutamate endopeptidase CwlK|tara:strand:- start:27293 stop:27685 length:393 start_codon:yes stop_codon:yes gene_type:complete
MPKFGKRSKERLKGVDARLINVCNELIKIMDCTIIEGVRSDEKQNEYFKNGKSKKDGIVNKGMHQLGKAIDLAPYPIDWNDRDRFHYMGGMVRGIAKQLNLKVRWGGDWDSDGQVYDNTFDDLVHIEIRG